MDATPSTISARRLMGGTISFILVAAIIAPRTGRVRVGVRATIRPGVPGFEARQVCDSSA